MMVLRAHKAPALIGAVVLSIALAAQAADRRREETRGNIRVDSNLVMIPVTVTDPKNHPVLGLVSSEFRVFEGRSEQRVVHLSTDDAPLSIGIVFDASGSMSGKLTKAREAVVQFLKKANPADDFFLVKFSNRAELAVPFTTDPDDIEAGLQSVTSKGKTALLDAVYLALHHLKGGRNARKAILVISDGGENDSRYTEEETRRMLQEADVWLYSIGIYPRGGQVLPEEERGGPKLLTDISEETGGRHIAVQSANELPDAAAQIALELRNQYVLAYSPANAGTDGRFRRVLVKLADRRDLHLSWRAGYYAPNR